MSLGVCVGWALGCSEAAPPPVEVSGSASIGTLSTEGDDDSATLDDESSSSAGAGEAELDDGGGPAFDLGDDGGSVDSTGADCVGTQTLVAVVRDVSIAHPDFEYVIQIDPGIVQPQLGGDSKPVYAGLPATPTTNGQASFDQWFRDVAGVNQAFTVNIDLVDDGTGTFTYASAAFFPIDGVGFGAEGNPHNYHFTLELHTEFLYQGGEVFRFTGDDDLWVFVNGRLGIDLGGVHGAIPGEIDMDAQAAVLGITPGNVYRLEFFFAERHTTESNFRIDTTIGCLQNVPVG